MRPKVVVVSGLSGSGKSTVAKCFEDLGYYCVDNLPLPLLRQFLADPGMAQVENRSVAVVTDVRAPGFAEEIPLMLSEMNRQDAQVLLLFLEASDEALVRRFSETRRPHPLATDLPVLEAIHRERAMLAELRGMADLVFDTSQMSIHTIRAKVYKTFADPAERPGMQVSLSSFGFKHGQPMGSDLLFDVRFLPNPHFVEELRPLTGCDEPVQSFLADQPDFVELVERLEAFLLYLLPQYQEENRSYLSIAIGCTGGHHRSVAIVEELGERLAGAGWDVDLLHRDIDR